MDPAAYFLAFAPEAAPIVPRLQAELGRQGAPPIQVQRFDDVLAFRCQTGGFMLRSRVADALMSVCGHDEWTRLFWPLE